MEVTKQNEAEIDRRIERDLAGHRQAPDGRNAFALVMRYLNNHGYRDKFDDTFKGSPSSKEWWDDQFCPHCGMRKSACLCDVPESERLKGGEVRFMAPRGVIKG